MLNPSRSDLSCGSTPSSRIVLVPRSYGLLSTLTVVFSHQAPRRQSFHDNDGDHLPLNRNAVSERYFDFLILESFTAPRRFA